MIVTSLSRTFRALPTYLLASALALFTYGFVVYGGVSLLLGVRSMLGERAAAGVDDSFGAFLVSVGKKSLWAWIPLWLIVSILGWVRMPRWLMRAVSVAFALPTTVFVIMAVYVTPFPSPLSVTAGILGFLYGLGLPQFVPFPIGKPRWWGWVIGAVVIAAYGALAFSALTILFELL
jgi:hypothetical protein